MWETSHDADGKIIEKTLCMVRIKYFGGEDVAVNFMKGFATKYITGKVSKDDLCALRDAELVALNITVFRPSFK